MSATRDRGAVIFDMDGVLVHTTPLHLRIWAEWFASIGHDPGADGLHGVLGRRGEDVVAEVLGVDHDHATAEAVVAELYHRMLERLAADPLPLAPGAEALLDRLEAAGVPTALATSGRRDGVAALVGGLLPRFGAVVTAEDVTRGKPDPQVYTTAAARLGAPPAACTVVEDAVAGVRAGRAAGMRVVAVTTTASRQALAAAGAAVVADRLDALAPALLAGSPGGEDRPIAVPAAGGRSSDDGWKE